jgi:hypothetical protein
MVNIETAASAKKRIRETRGSMREYFSDPHFTLSDQVVIVLGNSPAINEVDLTLLDSVITIGVNRICRSYTPTVLLLTDPPILEAEDEWFKKFDGPILTWHGFNRKQWVTDEDRIRYFNLQPNGPHTSWCWPKRKEDPLIREGTTPPYALQLAALAGAKAIGMLGVDLSAPDLVKKQEASHFYGPAFGMMTCKACSEVFPRSTITVVGKNRKMKCPACAIIDKVIPFCSTGGGGWSPIHHAFFGKFPEFARSLGVNEVYNLSPYKDTPIHKAEWPKLTVEEFVTKFTKGT